MEYAAILCQGNTREGYPIAAAALIEGEAGESNLSLSVCLGSSTDGLVIDVCLARLVRTLFPGAAAAGASIYIPGAREPCGGVAGDPAELEHSAQDNVFTLTNGLVGFAFPGQFSVIGAFSQDEICTLLRETKAQFRGEKATRPQLEAFLKDLVILAFLPIFMLKHQ